MTLQKAIDFGRLILSYSLYVVSSHLHGTGSHISWIIVGIGGFCIFFPIKTYSISTYIPMFFAALFGLFCIIFFNSWDNFGMTSACLLLGILFYKTKPVEENK